MNKPINKNLKAKAGPGEEYDYEGYMVRTQLRRMASQAQELLMLTKDEDKDRSGNEGLFYLHPDFNLIILSDMNDPDADDEFI